MNAEYQGSMQKYARYAGTGFDMDMFNNQVNGDDQIFRSLDNRIRQLESDIAILKKYIGSIENRLDGITAEDVGTLALLKNITR